jgi:hypothetical protein
MAKNDQTEFEMMRERAENIERELRRRDVAEAVAAGAKRKAEQAAADAAASAEAVTAREAALEKTRRRQGLGGRQRRVRETVG